MNRFTPEELRRGVIALDTILAYGDLDEWQYILREAEGNDAAPSSNPWLYATARQRLNGGAIAHKLSKLLGEDIERCELAAAEVYAKQRHRVAYEALLAYAAELTGKVGTTPIKRQPVRIVQAKKGDAA